MPAGHRQQLLQLAHDHNGHLSTKKIRAVLKRIVTWPGIHKDIVEWCTRCDICQKEARARAPRAPMEEIPVMTVPFEKIAIDLVGPFQRSKAGYKYLLTVIDLASRYPEALPLKIASATEVAEGLLEVFARHGLPRQILSDQGSNLTGRVMTELCQKLKIDKIHTSSYHPESNGCVERFHGTLVPMLRKAIDSKLDWPDQIKFCLYAIRAVPNRSTGYSPFEILHGVNMRSPVDLVVEGWMSIEKKSFNVTKWMEELNNRLEKIKDIMYDNGLMAQAKAKQQHDKKTQVRQINEGDMVLLRSPGMLGKLDTAWKGPFEVLRKVSRVNVELGFPGGTRKKKRVVHVNHIKPYKQAETKVLRVMVIAEDPDEDELTPLLRGDQLDPVQQKELNHFLESMSTVFTNDPGLTNVCSHDIDTGNTKPIRIPPYALSQAKREGVKKEINILQEMGIIVSSTSPWSFPIVPIVKPDGSIRVCVDYRKLNSVTVPDPYFMPKIEDLICQVGDSVFLSKMDLSKGFYQVPLTLSAREKTAFITPFGKFHFTRMPFGLRNAPTTFQRLMEVVLVKQIEFASPYIDDILIYSQSWKDHQHHISAVVNALQQAGLTAKPSKCLWAKSKLEYLGHLVGNGQVEVPEAKIQALRNYKLPETKVQLRSFLGLASYYRRFIERFADCAKLLHDATRKEAPLTVEWTEERRKCFDHLCTVLCKSCMLHIPKSDDHYLLQTDASCDGIGSCLSVCRNEQELPVAFYSRQLRAAETRYSATELECLAVVESVKHFEIYLDGHQFTIQTDHRALEYLRSATFANKRLCRWALRLQGLDFTIKYRPGRSNGNADGMSRQAWKSSIKENSEERPRTDVN